MSTFFRKHWKWLIPIVISIIVPVWQGKLFEKTKSLSFEIKSITPLITSQPSNIAELKIIFKNKLIESPYLTMLSITNNGDIPIIKSDYEGPLLISTSQPNVIKADITDRNPNNMDAKITWDTEKILLAPTLLNAGDSITMQVLTSGNKPQFLTQGRILGIHKITTISESQIKHPILYVFMLFAGTLFFMMVASLSIDDTLSHWLNKDVSLKLSGKFLITFISAIPMMLTSETLIEALEIKDYWQQSILYVVLFSIGSILSIFFKKNNK